MSELTPKQKEILNYIKVTIEERGTAPTIREIGKALGLKSTATVHNHIKRLELKGDICRDPQQSNSIVIVNKEE